MIVSYNVAKYLGTLNYTRESRNEYWNGVLHSSFDSYRPVENTLPAPEVLDALDWVTTQSPYTIELVHDDKGYRAVIKDKLSEHVLSPFNKISDAIISSLEYVATKALES